MENILNKYIDFCNIEIIIEQEVTENSQEDINNNILKNYNFMLPIEYHKHKKLIDIVKDDTELNGVNNIYNNIIKNKDVENKNLLINKWSSIYSTDKGFLKDNQKLLKNYNYYKNDMNNFINEYINYKGEQNFINKYQYIQFKRFMYLNNYSSFLYVLGFYNICSPLFSLLTPIFGMIIPYFVLYFKGIKLSFSQYFTLLKGIILNNNMINGIFNFHKNSFQKNIYTIMSIFFYVMSIYNNIISCINFYKNTTYIIEYINNYNKFLFNGEMLINNIYKQTNNCRKFKEFNQNMLLYKDKIINLKNKLSIISDINKSQQILQYGQLGTLLQYNYELFNNESHHDVIMYLIYLNNYNQDLYSINCLIRTKKLNKCKYVKNCKPKITNLYYLPYINGNYIDNNIDLSNNIIVTGPNAAGKTTLIKSIIINLFLSQSIGFGCYSSCKTPIYDYFHSYLNIPDTSNRDSLFQAEARRCKEIIEFIDNKKNKKHFCIFDEIYSGTNPNDAILCATLYLKGLNTYKKNVDYILTTHYTQMCESFNNDKIIKNKKMKINNSKDGNGLIYLYKIIDGISYINGGFQILIQLDYPKKILDLYNN